MNGRALSPHIGRVVVSFDPASRAVVAATIEDVGAHYEPRSGTRIVVLREPQDLEVGALAHRGVPLDWTAARYERVGVCGAHAIVEPTCWARLACAALGRPRAA